MRSVLTVFCTLALLAAWSPGASASDKTHTNSFDMEFVLIPAGSFERVIPEHKDASGRVVPAKTVRVTITKPFYLGRYEVTKKQWYEVEASYQTEEVIEIGDAPAPAEEGLPVNGKSWPDVQEFIYKLTYTVDGGLYRLPTEAEWDYAARGGTDSAWFFGDDPALLGDYAWYDDNSGGDAHPVGRKKPNPYGLYDIYGNVDEWVLDWYAEYPGHDVTDPAGPLEGFHRITRGGYMYSSREMDFPGNRNTSSPYSYSDGTGFRLVYVPDE
jgi:formylglycine-generating enzyme required for sulfatase activity